MPHPPAFLYSVVVPVYCEAQSIPELVARLKSVFDALGKLDAYEIVFVDDGSTDNTKEVIRRLAAEERNLRSVNFRRNCGKSLALMAGFMNAVGEIVITMDGDLQDRPEDIPALLEKLNEGYDLVGGWRVNRHGGLVRRIGSSLFNRTVAWSTGLKLHDFNCGLKAIRRELFSALSIYGQYHRYIPLLSYLLGFRVTEVPITNDPRKFGSSKYAAIRYQGLFDLLSILFTHKYGLNPLHFFGIIGMLLMLAGGGTILWFICQQFLFYFGFGAEFMVQNRPLLILAIAAFLFGGLVFLTGFVCDFILHHQIRSRIGSIINLSIADVTEIGGCPRNAFPPTDDRAT